MLHWNCRGVYTVLTLEQMLHRKSKKVFLPFKGRGYNLGPKMTSTFSLLLATRCYHKSGFTQISFFPKVFFRKSLNFFNEFHWRSLEIYGKKTFGKKQEKNKKNRNREKERGVAKGMRNLFQWLKGLDDLAGLLWADFLIPLIILARRFLYGSPFSCPNIPNKLITFL